MFLQTQLHLPAGQWEGGQERGPPTMGCWVVKQSWPLSASTHQQPHLGMERVQTLGSASS